MFAVLLIEFISIGLTSAERLGYPDYTSVWTLMSAQSDNSSLNLNHGLGMVPGLVEVLVTPVDGPYKGFLFKATGSANKDDDSALQYGGVVYVYDETSVWVIVPRRNNGQLSGYAIHTGDSEYWTGGTTYVSLDAYVKVRCWLPRNMPTPCFQANDIQVEAGPTSTEPTYVELSHGAGQLPELVSVRIRMTDSEFRGWYTDSQGTNRYISSGKNERHGGVKYGFDVKTVRIWIPSADGQGKYLFNANDGWGTQSTQNTLSQTGVMDVRVWCNMGLTEFVKKSSNLGPGVTDEQFTLSLNTLDNPPSYLEVFASIMIQTVGGENDGYYFNGIDGATAQDPQTDVPCAYGGFVYSYNTQGINLRRPSQDQGAVVCIADTNGDGRNTGASQNGVVSVRMWNLDFQAGNTISNKYRRYQNYVIDYPDIGTVRTGTSRACLYECAKRTLCVAVDYNHLETLCRMYDYYSTGSVMSSNGSDVWQVV